MVKRSEKSTEVLIAADGQMVSHSPLQIWDWHSPCKESLVAHTTPWYPAGGWISNLSVTMAGLLLERRSMSNSWFCWRWISKKKKKSTTESIGNCCCCFVETPSANPSPLSLHQAWLYIPGESRSNGPGTAKNMDRSSAADVASS